MDIMILICIVLCCLVVYQQVNYGRRNHNLKQDRENIAKAAHIYQKSVYSMVKAYREIYFIDLERDTCRMVHSDSGELEKKGSYLDKIALHLATGVIAAEDQREAERFISPDHIRECLSDADSMEMPYRRKYGNGLEWCLVTITVADRERENGAPVTVTMAIRGIDELMSREERERERLYRAAEQAKGASEAKSAFLSQMSHDIRTPLNAMIGLATVAAEHEDEPERMRDYLKKITVSGEHLLNLLSEVLDLSTIESGTVLLRENPFDLVDTIQKLGSLFQEKFSQKKICYKTIIADSLERNVIGDVGRFQQILINIVSNAVKFTKEGGVIELYVSERTSTLEGYCCYEFRIRDNGMGMNAEFCEHVFEPFARSGEAVESGAEGTGLGMSIALNLARIMHGNIQVESELGKGSVFTVTLFLKRGGQEEQGQDNFEQFRRLRFHNKRVLLADDNELNVQVARELLKEVGIEVETVGDGASVLQNLQDRPPYTYDMIFMDIQMPMLDGLQTCKKIRAMDRIDVQTIPVIAMTANAFVQDLQRIQAAGMNDYLLKPIRIQKLQNILETYLTV